MTRLHVFSVSAFSMVALALAAPPASTEPACGEQQVRIVLVGDSTVSNTAGWGKSFKTLLKPQIVCINTGIGGRSSKSFRDEGHWSQALAHKPTHVLIQFGHNDQPGKGPERQTDPQTTYRQNLVRYVEEVRAAGATPILVTPVARRLFEKGKLRGEKLDAYVPAVRAVAAELKTPLVDLNAASRTLYEQLGEAEAAKLGSEPTDRTHFGPEGGMVIARLLAEGLKKADPACAAWFLAEVRPVFTHPTTAPSIQIDQLPSAPSVTVAFRVKVEKFDEKAGGAVELYQPGDWSAGCLRMILRNVSKPEFIQAKKYLASWQMELHAGGPKPLTLAVQRPRLEPGQTAHLALSIDGPGRIARLYMDGTQEDAVPLPAGLPPLRLGEAILGVQSGAPEPRFAGEISDLRVFDCALTPEQIVALGPPQWRLMAGDWRNSRNGHIIPDENYVDQPYIVITPEGHWVCTMTTGPGNESDHTQHIVSTRSTDKGRTWEKPVAIEPSADREASWVVPLITPSGRIYAFYTYNHDEVRTAGGKKISGSMVGWYAYKYSDDGGRTWSAQRYRIPWRWTAIDRDNGVDNNQPIFWGIDKPDIYEGTVYLAFTKITRKPKAHREGFVLKSANLLTEPDPAKHQWQMLPEGDRGVVNPAFSVIQEEHNLVPLSGQSLYMVCRTTHGYPLASYSRDGGVRWSTPEPMTYTPGGKRIKNPQGCPMLWKTAEGKYLFWFHHNGEKDTSQTARNPVWISGGIETDGRIRWSQPEILLYEPNHGMGLSYPDLVEQDGRFWVTATQKVVARVHEVDRGLLDGLWRQAENSAVTRDGLFFEIGAAEIKNATPPMLGALNIQDTGGMTIEMRVKLDDLRPDQVLLDATNSAKRGFAIRVFDGDTLRAEYSDGKAVTAGNTDGDVLTAGRWHHVVAIIDAGPQVVMWIVDGVVCDGGNKRKWGWRRYADAIGEIAGGQTLRLAPLLRGQIEYVRLYNRPLRVSEAVGNYSASLARP